MEKENAFGVAARIGWVTPHRALAYGRFGVSSAAIRTDYTHNADVYGETKRHTGLSAGFGIEAPAGARGFVRAEYLVTSYESLLWIQATRRRLSIQMGPCLLCAISDPVSNSSSRPGTSLTLDFSSWCAMESDAPATR